MWVFGRASAFGRVLPGRAAPGRAASGHLQPAAMDVAGKKGPRCPGPAVGFLLRSEEAGNLASAGEDPVTLPWQKEIIM